MTLRRRFLLLRATRWFPTGLLVPVLVLMLVDRGFSLSRIGLAFAVQGLTVLVLELPTGGLADVFGRRRVLFLATAIEVLALTLLLTVETMPGLVAVFLLLGIYRALESGPLDAWYVDAAHAQSPDLDLGRDLSAAGGVTSLALAGGAVLAGGLVALDPSLVSDALVAPLVLALVLRAVDLVAIAMLMTDTGTAGPSAVAAGALRHVPAVVRETLATVRHSRALATLLAVEFFWGFGMVSFESLGPVKLAEVTADPVRAAALFGPATTAAWIAAAAGAAVAPRLGRRLGIPAAAMGLQALQAAAVILLALMSGVVGVVVFYVVTIALHGAINPLYQTLLHDHADPSNRATVLSAASMAAHPGGALGGIALGSVAQHLSITTAMLLGAVALAVAVPLYLPTARHHRDLA